MIGDNGAGKSSLIWALSGATVPDEGEILLDGQRIQFKAPSTRAARASKPCTRTLAVAPAMTIAETCSWAELRRPGLLGSALRMLDKKKMKKAWPHGRAGRSASAP